MNEIDRVAFVLFASVYFSQSMESATVMDYTTEQPHCNHTFCVSQALEFIVDVYGKLTIVSI